MVEVGGHCGEFAHRVSCHYPELQATVVDSPTLCDLGQQLLLRRAPQNAVRFVASDVDRAPIPVNGDLVCFKSTLHDWNSSRATQVLNRAVAQLPSGGRVMIYERAPVPVGRLLNRFHLLPLVVQFRSFRSPEFYTRALRCFGCRTSVQYVNLDTPFFIVTGVKP